MDIDPRTFFSLLHKYLDDENSGPQQCNQLFLNLNEALTREQISLPDLDLYLRHWFNKSHGLSDFITQVVNKKTFKSSIINAFEIIYTLINNFSSKLEKYITVIYDICFKIINSLLVSSDEKVKALQVINLSFEKINKSLELPECYTDVYNNLIKSISIKKCSTVEEKIFTALGTFAKHFQYMITNPENLKLIFLSSLENQMTLKEFAPRSVSGIFLGLDGFCESFPLDPNSKDGMAVINKLYKYLERLAVPSSTVKTANRAALTFLANNMSLFINLMLQKVQHWHENFLKWLTYGAEDQKVGFYVTESFYRSMGNVLMNDVFQTHRPAIMYFLEWFKKNLNKSDISTREKRLCLQGLSSFFAIYLVQLNEEEMKNIHTLIIENFEQAFIYNQEPATDILGDLPFYLETVAKLIHFRKISNSELFCLQRGTIMLLKVYPQLPYGCHGAVTEALISTFYYVFSNDEKIFDNFVETVIYQGVVWTCSHQYVSEADSQEQVSDNLVNVKTYFNMWKALLGILPSRKFDKLGIFLHDRKYILIKIIDKLIRTLLILINKLNVSVILKNTTEPVTEIECAYRVVEVNDFAIFLNAVDFYGEIFDEIDPSILRKCICKLIHHLVSKCGKFPLISGFYKLLSCCLKVCNKIKYFDESFNDFAQDVKMCILTLTKFADCLLNKTQEFKGDLLIACLQVLLEYPMVIVQKMLPACIPAFKTIFELGRSYIKLAHMALDTLENWQKGIAPEEMELFLIRIIPLFDFYLQNRSLGNFTDSSVSETRRKTAQLLKKRKVVINIEPELVRLQMRIMSFIGEQRYTLCDALAFREDNSNLSVWSNQQHLKIVLPYEEIKLDIYLDKLLPRITNVALNGTDRKSRVMACELLQATIMIFLATTKQMTQSGLSDLNELLRYVSVPLLKLGCDMDQVVEQLFRPLCFQLIHWYTHASQSRTEHSAIIIEAILESITHPTDAALRDFSGKCVNEFIKWTIKQTTEKNLARDPINIKILVKKMRFYSTHPDSSKKLGAALIFNNMYRELREESSLLSIFWIEFLHIFVKSLATYEYDAVSENTITQIYSALAHVERGFVEKSKLFNSNDRDRRIPADMHGGVLKDVVVWLLEQTGSLNRYCRTKCIELFCSIAPHTEGYNTLQKFFVSHFKEKNWIQETYEPLLMQYSTLEQLSESDNVDPNKWLQAFLCVLDGYKFVITHKLVCAENVQSESLATAIAYFLSKVSTASLGDAFALIQNKEWLFTTFEKQVFDKQKSHVVLNILEFLTVLAPHANFFYTPDLWNLVVNVIFNRELLGFDSFASNKNADSEIALILKFFLTKLTKNTSLELFKVLENYVNENLMEDFDVKSNVPLKQRNILKGLNMLDTFSLEHFTFNKFCKGMITQLLSRFICEAENEIIYACNMQDTALNYCLSLLDFALLNEEEFECFVNFMYKPYRVQTDHYKQPILFGTYILTVFEDSVMEKIISNFGMFLELSLKKCMINQTSEIIFHILSYTIPNKSLRKVNEGVVKNIITNWNIFDNHFSVNFNSIEDGLNFVKCLTPVIKMGNLECESLKKWLIRFLGCEQDMGWKHELDTKAEIFFLLVDIMEPADGENKDLRAALINLNNKISSELSCISIETKTIFLEKLLSVLPKIKTLQLLIFLLEIYVKISTETNRSDMKTLLFSYVINNQQAQKNTLFKVYDLYSSENFDNYQKYKLATHTASLFHGCNISVFEEFFIAKISEILSVLKRPTICQNLITKISQFLLVEILFLRHPVRSTDGEISQIVQAALPQKPNNKTFLLQLLKFTLDAFKDSIESTSDVNDLLRLYKCHAYNAMVSIVSNSMKEINFYTKLFIRQENNVDILWNSLIDTNKNYSFQTDFDSVPNKRKILVNIRDEIRTQKKMQNSQFQSARYINSMRIYNSSLSEDLTKFDFTNNIIRTQLEQENIDQEISIQSEIELDSTDINNHESMATVCGLIEYIVNTRITELPSEEEDGYELPAWVNGIRTLLLNPETHGNIKIFWVKVIDNTIHIFKHFAKWFLEPLLKFIVDKSAGSTFNYFITDVVVVLATWSIEVLPNTETEVQLASDLLTFLIENLDNGRQDMFKYHLELIRLLIESWRSSVKIPYDLIYSKLNVDPVAKKVEIGIHLSSIFLANKMFPPTDDITNFCKTFFNIIKNNNHKSIYKPCAENVGLLLRLTNDDSRFSKISRNVQVLLKKISTTDPEKYAHTLEAMVLHYPPVADEFHLILLLSKVHGVPKVLKVVYLRIILTRIGAMSQINDFKTERWDVYIENDNLEVQLLSLEIVYKSLEVLKESPFFKKIIESVCTHINNSNVLCRTRMFDIVISISQDFYYPDEIKNLSKPVLVQGLTDLDLEIRDKVYDFLRNNPQLPAPISRRFVHILENLYETSTEGDFLGYSSYFLLDIIKKTEEYNNTLFQHPLEDCDFESYQLQTNWRARHSSVVPLFAETVRSASLDFTTFDTDANKLRQTQAFNEFAATQSVRGAQFSQFTMSESSLFIKPEDSTFVNPNLVPLSHKYRIPKRRFLRDKSKIQGYFAHQEVKKSIAKVERRKDMAKEHEHKVTIYRSYRKGDLPDVQITLQAVLEPLQALALHDGEVSKILYSELFQSILEKMKNDQDFLRRISAAIKAIFTNSIQFNRNLFRTLFDALFQCKNWMIFPADLVVSVCQSSGLRALGVLLLEEYLISFVSTSSDSKKMRGGDSTNEISLWIKLAELYKEMDEWDVVKSIFLEKTECSVIVKDALVTESRKQWKEAQLVYKQLIETDNSFERKDFYYESYFRCFAHLGEWNKLVDSIDSIVIHSGSTCWNDLWDQGFYQQKLMPWYISGHLKSVLFTENFSNDFFTALNTSLNSEHLDFLETHFCEEIAMLWIFKGEVDEAEKYLNIYLTNFLNHWQQLDLFYANLRYNSLLKLRNIIDIKKFIYVYNNVNVENKTKIQELINFWNRTAFENLPSILFSEEKVLYRRQFLNLLTNKIKSCNEEELEDLINEMTKLKFNLDEGVMEIGLEQNNFYMTKKYLSNYNKQNILKLKLVLSKLAFIKSSIYTSSASKLEVLMKGCENLGPIFQQDQQTFLKVQANVQFFKQLEQICSILLKNDTLFQEKKTDLSVLVENSISSPLDLTKIGANKLKSILHAYENNFESEMESETLRTCTEHQTIANAYVQLAYFAKEQGQTQFSDFMLFVLRAMKFNSSEGKQLFPCIIMEEEFSQHDTNQFIQEIDSLPTWMFLAWIPQILVNVDSLKVSAVAPLIMKIAKTYPQAIMYAYRISKENYKCENEESKQLIAKLDEILLCDDRIDTFLKALSSVGIPASILDYYVRKMGKLCATNNMEQVKTILNNLQTEIFSCKPDSRDTTLLQGNMFKKISRFEKDFKNIERLTDQKNTVAEIIKQLKKINDDVMKILHDISETKKNSRLLKDYCPWLANFSVNKMNLDLEIPGQYDGNRMPLIQHHTRIAGFCPNVLVMSSLRKPIKIIMLGNNTKEYPFLIKFGEDVRQDQRIQQLFLLMNNIFENDPSLQGRKFSILTYQVIPLTTSLGIIQWIDKTSSLQEFIKNSLKRDVKLLKAFDQNFETYHKWVHKTGNQANVDAYGRAAMNYSRDKIIPKFRALTSSIEWNVLRFQFLKLSTNVESFYALRHNFIKSYAVMCVGQWILGVGDRHLSNSLICLQNGKVLGIDFGHAFGTATQILPVPELVPFRLTPHLINLMEPLGEKGLFREIMVHCLRSLRCNSGSLLSTMNVFIEEPSLDWLEHAARFNGSTNTSDCLWYPAQKIEQAKWKLRGANSAPIIIQDLKAGHHKNPLYMKAYIKLVQGEPEFDIRARKQSDDLPVEDQVDCLIDHATDYNLLGRMFEGWAAWV